MVPVSFTVMGEAVSRRALNLLNDNRSVLADMWRNIKGDNEEKLARWKQWEGVMKSREYSKCIEVWKWCYTPFHSDFVKKL